MLHLIFGLVVPDVSKDYSDFIFRVMQSKKSDNILDCLTLKINSLQSFETLGTFTQQHSIAFQMA
jgi:hypothetical protein